MKFAVIGCGKMGTALVAGAIQSGALRAEEVIGLDPIEAARQHFARTCQCRVTAAWNDLADCEAILLCTKPYDVAAALQSFATLRGNAPWLLISIAAGVTLHALQQYAGDSARVIRAMPNTPALISMGAAGFCRGNSATEDDAALAAKLLGSVGVAVAVSESLMDVVTGLSGSGPAYGYLMIEALSDGAVRMGLPRAEATRLAAQTLLGSAAMVLQTGLHPGELKDMVTSPGGTTIAGLAELERHGLRSALIEAVTAATRRSSELGKA